MTRIFVALCLLCCSAVAQTPIVAGPPAASLGSGTLPTPTPVIDDPVQNPLGAIDDFEAAKRHGWPAAVLVGGIMLAMACRTLGRRLPNVGWLAWLNTGKRAFWITGGITVASAVLDVLWAGGSTYAMGWAGVLSIVALLNAQARSE